MKTNRYSIPINMRGFTSLSAAKAHRQVVGKLTGLRDSAAEVAQDLMGIDKVEVEAETSEPFKDLAAGKGKVIALAESESQGLEGFELDYEPETGRVRRFEADLHNGNLTQNGGTYRWETKDEANPSTTLFSFDDKRGIITVEDPNNAIPAIFEGANPDEITKNSKLILTSSPILITDFKDINPELLRSIG